MAIATRCLDCGQRTKGSRCPDCAARRDNWQGRRRIANGWQWATIRQQVHARDRVCVRCGSHSRLQVHHRVPLRDGGSNELTNLLLLCHRCHVQEAGKRGAPGPL